MGSEESTEVGRGGNEDVEIDVWCNIYIMSRIRNHRIRWKMKLGEISKYKKQG